MIGQSGFSLDIFVRWNLSGYAVHEIEGRTMAHEVTCPDMVARAVSSYALDSGESVGFFWGDDTDMVRPDAWCRSCEQAPLVVPKGPSTANWFLACDYEVFSASCWDYAKQVTLERAKRS
jgi:hypothetical protein